MNTLFAWKYIKKPNGFALAKKWIVLSIILGGILVVSLVGIGLHLSKSINGTYISLNEGEEVLYRFNDELFLFTDGSRSEYGKLSHKENTITLQFDDGDTEILTRKGKYVFRKDSKYDELPVAETGKRTFSKYQYSKYTDGSHYYVGEGLVLFDTGEYKYTKAIICDLFTNNIEELGTYKLNADTLVLTANDTGKDTTLLVINGNYYTDIFVKQ